MGEVLSIGITHYPPLATPDDKMSWILKYMLKNPQLPEKYRDPALWPEQMRAEWGADTGTAAATKHREQLVGWMRKVRTALDAFKPDYVVMFGDDQYENFHEDVIPPYCTFAFDKFSFSAPPGNVWNEPTTKSFEVMGAPAQAKRLVSELIEMDFDMAYAYKPLHHQLGHAFHNGLLFLDYDRQKGFPYPIIPVAINCYGRRVIAQRGGLPNFDKVLTESELDPPAPTPRRLFDLGAAIAKILARGSDRVAILASSGWSHAFLVDKHAGIHPDTEADRRMFGAMVSGNYDVWRNLTGVQVEDSGQQEMLNWSCLVGAMAQMQHKPVDAGLVTTWIFNSSKAFMIAKDSPQ
jgi:hypothetical protein